VVEGKQQGKTKKQENNKEEQVMAEVVIDAKDLEKNLLKQVSDEVGVKTMSSPQNTLKAVVYKISKMKEEQIDALSERTIALYLKAIGEGPDKDPEEQEEAPKENKKEKPVMKKKAEEEAPAKAPVSKKAPKKKAPEKKADAPKSKAKEEKPEKKAMSWKKRFDESGNPFKDGSNAYYAFAALKKVKYDSEKAVEGFKKLLGDNDVACSDPEGRLKKILVALKKEGIVG